MNRNEPLPIWKGDIDCGRHYEMLVRHDRI